MLGLRTDLQVPFAVEGVGIYMQRIEGDRTTTLAPIEIQAYTDEAGQRRVYLPGTLALENPGVEGLRVRVRIVAYDKAGNVLVMRESRVGVPTDRLASLPMPLLWMNTADVVDADPAAGGPKLSIETGDAPSFLQSTGGSPVDAFGRFRSDFCGDDRTLDDRGACQLVDVDVEGLETYREPGAAGTTAPGKAENLGGAKRAFCQRDTESSCFDVARCFATDEDPNYQPIEVPTNAIEGLGTSACSVSLSGAPDMKVPDVALAVRTSEAEGATCVREGVCYIALDSRSGFSIDAEGRRITLPPGVCRKAQKGSVISIVASPLCNRLKAEEPTCRDEGCLDGSGWDLGRDPGLPADDAGTDAGGACAEVAGATGLWVDDVHVTLFGGGALTRFSVDQLGAECLTGTPATTVPAPDLADVPYRLYGSDLPEYAGTVAFSSASGATGRSSAGLFDGTLRRVPASPEGTVHQGCAFFGSDASVHAGHRLFMGFSPSQTTSTAMHELSFTSTATSNPSQRDLPGQLHDPSNVLPTPDGLGTLQAVVDGSVLALVRCAPSCTVTPITPPLQAKPVHLVVGADGVTALLARTPDGVVVLTTDTAGALRADSARSFAGGEVPEESTLALAGTGEARVYYIPTRTALVSQTGSEPAAPVASMPAGGRLHAVQVRGNRLYWLQSDPDGRSSVHHRPLDVDGQIVPVP